MKPFTKTAADQPGQLYQLRRIGCRRCARCLDSFRGEPAQKDRPSHRREDPEREGGF